MFVAIFFILSYQEIYYADDVVTLHPGDYFIQIIGGQGGAGHDGSDSPLGSGGKGAYIEGNIHITKQAKAELIVGTQGDSGNPGPNNGGLPDGGDSGKDTGLSSNDASGAGGGSSRLSIDSQIIAIAAGGSGAVGSMEGCPGGEVGYVYCGVEGDTCQKSDQETNGFLNQNGGNGADNAAFSGSGGGGGYYGGKGGAGTFWPATSNFEAMGCSGSSFYDSGFLKSPKVLSGNNIDHTGNGLINITVNYLCKDECSDCNSSTECSKCSDPYALSYGQCVTKCPSGQIAISNVCTHCDSNCAECSDSITQCTACNSNMKLYNNSCYEECPSGTYESGDECKLCSEACEQCSGSATTCTVCHDGDYMYQNSCYHQCPERTYTDIATMTCQPCNSTCHNCSDAQTCTSCHEYDTLIDGICYSECPSHYFNNSLGQCQICNDSCAECSRESSLCTSCNEGFLYQSKCYGQCPETTFQHGIICIDCSENCLTCTGSADLCLTCKENEFLYNSTCYSKCPNNTFLEEGSNECQACDKKCASCDVLRDNCTSCPPEMELIIVNGSGFCITSEPEESSTETEGDIESSPFEESETESSSTNNAAVDGTADRNDSNNGLIYGCICAAVAIVIVLAVVIIVLLKKKKQQESTAETSSVEAQEEIFIRTDFNVSTNTVDNPLWSSANDEVDLFTNDFEENYPYNIDNIDEY